MPVEFLTDEQAEAYGRFVEEPTRPELERFFFLDDVDRDLIALRRTQHHQLGFAVQMCTVRYVGRFLVDDPLDVPWSVVEYLAGQLGIDDPSCVKRYTERRQTAYDHAWEIRDAYGYHQFEDREWGRKFRALLHGRAWTHAEGPVALFNQAVGWLRRNRVLLPGASVLAKQVAAVRSVTEKRLYATVANAARRADASLPADLVALLEVPEGRRISELERLRRPPTRTTGTGMAKALERMDEISAFHLGRVKLDKVPPNRLATLARVGLGSKAPILERTPEPRRTALLASVVRQLEASAIDDALDLFTLLMQVKLISAARRATDRDWMAARGQVAKAYRMVDGVFRLWSEQLDLMAASGADLDPGAMWRALETEIGPREEVQAASKLVGELIGPGDDEAEAEMRRLLGSRYNTVRPFLSLLGESPALGTASGGKRILEAVKRLPALARRKVKAKPLLPREIDQKLVPPAWRKAVYSNPELPEGAVDRDAYVVCVLEQLFRALNRRDVFASPSNRWADPRARLLDGKQWEAVADDVLASLSLDEPVEEHLAGRVRALDAAWQLMAERLEEAGQDAKLSFEIQPNGRLKLNVDRLGALGESRSLKWLRKTTAAMLPKIDLPDLLFEVDSWTSFLDAFVHLGDGRTRMEDIKTSLVALLVAEACNIGLTPVADPNEEALTRARLVHVDQYYLRADTIAAANALLIEAQGKVPIVSQWGEGLLASVDGLRFVVPKRTIHAGPSPKYYHFKRGITWLNAVNDQVAGIGQMVVPGTPRDSLHVLDTLLNLDAGVKPEMVATDNASYSDMVFGLFSMLGYNFSPRFKDLADQRFWRAELASVATGGYGPLESPARNKVNLNKVITHWPDMLRVAGSLVTGQVRAYDLLRMFGREGRPTPLGQAFAEYGRIGKTLHLLRVVDPVDDTYRRQMNRQLTVQESRHKLARDICHGKRGQIMQAYRSGQEDQLGALGLVLNAVVLWTTRYMDAAVEELRALPAEEREHEVLDEDVARLSPLRHANLNVLGRYTFRGSQPSGGGLRPLRDPAAAGLDEDDEE
ncbi:Tn3 family transposase [Streptomyces sp. NPDC048212]|uniref:Tn3 family transposase n=1 Tax=unclassified Streptomyces TaxID=2593676 RepID=UPI002275385A|nr:MULTISPECIES: Tn3 family transposase [unclassified Streptomyces]MCY1649300.1 Tn3 family transposase [Streptomyces sp. SL203]MCY1677012.1 Tn3 family transposase [Streptomyces sp. SL294]